MSSRLANPNPIDPPGSLSVPRRPSAASGLVALTEDSSLVDSLGAAIEGAHPFNVVASDRALGDHVMRSGAGAALIDSSASSEPIAQLTERLAQQFPDLVLVVVGTHAEQVALAPQITDGRVFRFVLQPASIQRLKVSIESALRRHDSAPPPPEPVHAAATPPLPGAPRTLLLLAVAAVVLGGAAIAWFASGSPETADAPAPAAAPVAPTAPSDLDPATTRILERADAALEAGALLEPPGESAVDLYRQVLAKAAGNARASEGIDRVVDALLTQAEAAIVAEQLDEADRLVATARGVRADHPRVAFLTAQLGKERERALLNEARKAAAGGNFARAIAVLDRGAPGSTSPLIAAARQEFAQQDNSGRVASMLVLADERVKSGALLAPDGDSARFYLDAARALAPEDPAIEAGMRALQVALIAAARTAIGGGDLAAAESRVAAAADNGVRGEELAQLRRELRDAGLARDANDFTALAQRFDRALAVGRLVEPADDNARQHLLAMRARNPTHPQTVAGVEALGAAMMVDARTALARSRIELAERWIADAEAIGYFAPEVDAARRDLAIVQGREASRLQVISAASLKRTRTVEPRYPEDARKAGITGWVDLSFTITAEGAVADAIVVDASPRAVFDEAALDAIRRWRFQPVERDGAAVEQRARLRMRFALE